MATAADNENYADIVLICDGHFDDPNLESRLTDITRQLHMLTTDTEEPLVTSVEPWNSVRVTLKVSRESAALLQTLAQQQDPKLFDIGILSVQVNDSNPICLDQPAEVSSKVNAVSGRVSADSSVRVATNSSTFVGACQSAVHLPLLQTAASAVQEATCSHAGGTTSNVNLSWHPLVDQRTATSSDDAGCSWDPFGYNGLSVDPFQFSADDLLTRMLADVPAPKRRRMRKGSAASATHVPFLPTNSLTVHEDCSSQTQSSNELYSAVPSGTESPAAQVPTCFDKDRATVSSCQQLRLPNSSQLNNPYNVLADSHDTLSVNSHPLYNHSPQNISSTACMLPLSLDSRMTVSNHNHAVYSDQTPVKRRHAKSQNLTAGYSTVGTYGAVTDINQHSPFKDVCSEGGVGDNIATRITNSVKSAEMHLPAAPESRYAVHSPRALWTEGLKGHPVLPVGYRNVSAYRFRLPGRESCPWTQSNSSYMYSDVPVSGTLPYVPSVRKPFSFGCGVAPMASRPSFATSLQSNGVSAVNETSVGTTWQPCHQQPFGSVALQRASMCDRLTGGDGYPPTTCTSLVHQPHTSGIGSRPSPANSHVGTATEVCSTMDYCGMPTSSMQPAGIVQSTSPRDGWTGSDSDYGSASATDSGIASNTSLSVGSDHSENDRGSVEMNAVDSTITAKLSPVSTADVPCAASSPLLASSADCLPDPQCDGSVTSSCGVMRMTPVSAGQNGDSCITAAKHSGKPQNWISDNGHSDGKKSGQSNARMRFARRSRQTTTLTGECPPAITCPSLPRRLSESVKRAMRGGAATDPPMTTAPCDIGPTKVVIRITKTRCSGTGEAKKSKQKEQWCVQPIVKPFQSPSEASPDVANTLNGSINCSPTINAKEAFTDLDSVSFNDPFDKSPHQKEFDVMTLHSAVDKRDSCQSSDFSGLLTNSLVPPTDTVLPSALSVVQDQRTDVDMVDCSEQNVANPAAVHYGNGAEPAAVLQNLT